MDSIDGNLGTSDAFEISVEDAINLDERRIRSFVTSPQETPRFTDSYSATLYQTPECYASTPSPQRNINFEDASSIQTSEPSDLQGDRSLDGDDDVDDDQEESLYRNPEPPIELLEQHLVDADNIGNTVFSKHWVFATLMSLLKSVEEADDGEASTTEPVELEDGLQDDLCKLWDMSMNQEVVNFLVEYNAVDILTGVIAKSKAPRATEICIGIIGNMACSSEVCHLLGSKKELVSLILLLLESPDAPTLVEIMRLLYVCVSSKKSELWLSAIREAAIVYDQVLFILQSSTNVDLLKNTAEFLDKLMEVDEDICTQWSNPELVVAVMEAIKQTGSHVSHILETFLHVLQLISTCEQGVQALATYCGQVCLLILGYLQHICLDDIVGVEGRENIIGSALSILSSIFSLWNERIHLLQTDFQLLRCTLKILDVVYQKHLRLPPALRNSRDISSSVCDDPREGHDPQEGNVCHKHDDHLQQEEPSSTFEGDPKSSNSGPSNSVAVSEANNNAQNRTDEVTLIKEKFDQSNEANTDQVFNENQSPQSPKEEEYTQEMTKILFELLQSLLSEIVTSLSELPVSEENTANGDVADSKDTNSEVSGSDEMPKIPMSLVYLDKLCDRQRLQYMLKTLDDIKDKDCIGALYNIGERHNLKRLCRIMQSTVARTIS